MSLLNVENVSYEVKQSRLFGRKLPVKTILQDISFSIEEGTCLSLIGTSGAGKTTLGKMVLGINHPTSGQVLFMGEPVYNTSNQAVRRNIQVVFQDPVSSVNPYMTIEKIITEPLLNMKVSKEERRREARDIIEKVGLKVSDLQKYPHQLSGGQLQRVTIARAIIVKPKLVVLDEAVSSLDMVTQSKILELLIELKTVAQLTYLFITHDIRAAFTISDRIGVLEEGKLVAIYDNSTDFLQSKYPVVQRLKDSILAEHPLFRTVRKV
ncbi:ATP-binding cassette domain-containing protein [Macrococcus hajekii]|uniref:ATP-binding cassette domain-containing protein n=2 Tax=Macrococcus hajekii TaxID=198482 RepID=A0A4R6BKA9_9STAP|nr:ATP-binding cassette domain-containing protein [Macrococcus hajekii]TDM02107.1 ATP-binding cassette domain-containing protein [Macrococcus hajekii]GGB07422.1 ABC transporter ATP-binding protein [Macrococcus hajekii]